MHFKVIIAVFMFLMWWAVLIFLKDKMKTDYKTKHFINTFNISKFLFYFILFLPHSAPSWILS